MSVRDHLDRLGRLLVGCALSAACLPLDIAGLIASIGGHPGRLARTVTGLHLARLRRWAGWSPEPHPASDDEIRRYLSRRCLIGLLAVFVMALLVYGALSVGLNVLAWVGVRSQNGAASVSAAEIVVLAVLSVVLLYLDLMGMIGVRALDLETADRSLQPDERLRLRHRVAELAVSRADVLAAVDGERQRIERDLHDGVQQQLVSLGILVGRARRAQAQGDPALDLLYRADREVTELLGVLRQIVWRISPANLTTHGLQPVLRTLSEAQDPPCSFSWHPEPGQRWSDATERTVYYAAAELLTNIARHAHADGSALEVSGDASSIRVSVIDDGRGGASPRPGHGLAGVAGRVDAAGGDLRVSSPDGGPTTITITIARADRCGS